MARLELYFFLVRDARSGKWRKTRYRLTREDAAAHFGDEARCLPETLEVRDVPENFLALKFNPFRGR